MAEKERTYIAIDLKSFYASVECVATSTRWEATTDSLKLCTHTHTHTPE